MDELRHPQNLSAQVRRNQRLTARPTRLGQTLQEAREDKGLELRDLSVLTNVRVMHLEALEKGDFHNLPEDPYGKNFVRLYAQAVGLEPSRMLLLYGQERRSAAAEGGALAAERALELPPETRGSLLDNPRLNGMLRLIATLLLVTGLVLTGLWLFNRTIAPSPRVPALNELRSTPEARPPTENPVQTPPRTANPPTPTPQMALLSIRTTPPGAEISIDGFSFGASPIADAPVQTGAHTLRIARAGYEPYEGKLELSRNQSLNVTLTPIGSAASPAVTLPTANNQITLTVTEEAWLEIYRGSARDEGERLVYETAPPGATYTFDAPLYVFSGNASGVSVTSNGQTEPLGEGVTGQAYSEE